ncbi:uncharacterized protein SOCE26_099520 [Sorangium cellulosum]|uniref:Uncharacterized protein n=1 Tax=Sorangium cellulosum TaxID=56 RepID=A0A2L0FA06_SORCE|nr:hypothetical protein [Sorangium cellulosum]AUX48418.1 uncharacterized protein SOCE26_099520 [Sorangium cellulosum]
MSSRTRSTTMNTAVETHRGEARPLPAGEAPSPPAGSGPSPSAPATGAAAVERGDGGGAELAPAAERALAQAVADGARALGESTVLCSVLLTVAIGCLAWSVPSPGASVGLTLLCLVLIAVEQAQARVRFQRAAVRAGREHGLTPPEVERAARALLEAESATRPRLG